MAATGGGLVRARIVAQPEAVTAWIGSGDWPTAANWALGPHLLRLLPRARPACGPSPPRFLSAVVPASNRWRPA